MDILTGSTKKSSRALALISSLINRTNLQDESLNFSILKERIQQLPPELSTLFAEPILEITNWDTNVLRESINWYKQKSCPIVDLLSELRLKEESPESAKTRGAIFTPYWLADRLVRNVSKNWSRLHRSGNQPSLIVDSSCGTGVFLLAAQKYFGDNLKLIGQDIDETSLLYARLLKYVNGTNWDLSCCDTLLTSPHIHNIFKSGRSQSLNADIMVGNPPYVRSQLLKKKYVTILQDHYQSTLYGNFDLSVAFIEHAIANLNEGGIASYIVPNKFMTSKYGRSIRKLLKDRTRIINIEDFQDFQLFKGYTTYTCIITFANKPKAKRFTIIRFPTNSQKFTEPGKGQTISLSTKSLSSDTWDFAAGPIHEVLRLLRNPINPMITEIIGPIYQGVRTGSNSVFVLNDVTSKMIESEVLKPFVGGEQIRRFSYEKGKLFILYPYIQSMLGEIRPLSPHELESNFPRCWKYLLKHRKELEERALDVTSVWYTFSRPQNLSMFCRKKILVREMMPRVEFASDDNGSVMFSSGYAIDASRLRIPDLHMWVAVLCTPTMEFILRHNSTQLHSGWFRLLKHYLGRNRLPLLQKDSLFEASHLADVLYENPNDVKALDNLDNIVANSFKLQNKHKQVIKNYLRDCHERSCSRILLAPTNGESIPTQLGREHKKDMSVYQPVKLNRFNKLHRERFDLQKYVTFLPNKSIPIHRWYPYTQGFSEQLVRFLFEEINISPGDTVLEPFGGCGTTALTCRKLGINSVSIDISPLMCWIAKVKTTRWDAKKLAVLLKKVKLCLSDIKNISLSESEAPIFNGFFLKAYSPSIFAQIKYIAKKINNMDFEKRFREFFLFGLISIMEDVSQIRKHGSHYRYMLDTENIGLQKLNTRIINPSSNIVPILIQKLESMIKDVSSIKFCRPLARCRIKVGDAKNLALSDDSVSAVITSPPYLNRNNYIAQQKAELSLLGFVKSYIEYRELVKSTFRSHVESQFDNKPITHFKEVKTILNAMELTENNNPKIPHMIAGYFEDINLTLKELKRVLRKGGKIAFVVGNTRWGGIVVPVDHLLSLVSEKNGFSVDKILITRYKGNSPQQMAKYGRIPVRESIVMMTRK